MPQMQSQPAPALSGPSPVTGALHARAWPAGVPHTLAVPDESLVRGLERFAQTRGDAVALQFLGREWTAAELLAEVRCLAAGLQALGLAPGERVLLFTQNSPAFVMAFHAVLMAGGVVVPVNPMNKADELEHVIADAGAQLAFASGDLAPELLRAQAVLGAGRGLRELVVFQAPDFLPDETLRALAVGHAPAWPQAWQAVLQASPLPEPAAGVRIHAWAAVSTTGGQPQAVPASGHDLALLAYTSGTTGAPKGCMHSHATLLHNALTAGPWLGLQAGDAQLVVVPLFHITGLVMGMLAALQAQARIVLLPRWDRAQAAQAIAEQRVTHWPNIPTMLIDLLAAPEADSFDLSSLRYIGGGGAPMPEPVADRLKALTGLDYLEGYGLTETAAPTHTNPPQAVKRRCLGIPYIGTRARVVDPVTLEDMPAGEPGEILVNGPQVFLGYWGQPEATAQAFVERDGLRWFRTGDLGRIDEDGYFHLSDRLKRMINASGFKVWPAEVEALMYRHPGVQEVCVVRLSDAYRGESVKAVVVPRAGALPALDEAGLIAWCREHMAAYKVPRRIEFAQTLPRSASGKVLWRVVQDVEDRQAPAPGAAS